MAVKSGLLFATINPLFAKIKLLMAITGQQENHAFSKVKAAVEEIALFPVQRKAWISDQCQY
jgi:hypothetical protein